MSGQFVAFCPRCNGDTAHKACFIAEHGDCIVCLWCRGHHLHTNQPLRSQRCGWPGAHHFRRAAVFGRGLRSCRHGSRCVWSGEWYPDL